MLEVTRLPLYVIKQRIMSVRNPSSSYGHNVAAVRGCDWNSTSHHVVLPSTSHCRVNVFDPKPSRHQSVISKVTSSCFLTNKTDLAAYALALLFVYTWRITFTAQWDSLDVTEITLSSFRCYSGEGILKFVLTHIVIWLIFSVFFFKEGNQND